jgi:hypothetical protein
MVELRLDVELRPAALAALPLISAAPSRLHRQVPWGRTSISTEEPAREIPLAFIERLAGG